MNLVELLLATSVLLGSSAASLGVWQKVSVNLVEHRQELERLASLEAEVQAQEARLLDPNLDALGPQLSCEEQLQRLAARLENQPPAAGVVRTLDMPVGAEFLLIHLRAGDQERRRLYSPAAFGGCGGATANLPAVDPAQASAEGGSHGAL
jgi:hypothetical protein